MPNIISLLLLISQAAAVSFFRTPSTSNPSFISGSNGIEVLKIGSNQTESIIVLDYGREVEGIPSFEVVSAEGNTSIFEITYAESLVALDKYMSDGPLPLAAAMDTYRVNRYNISFSSGTVTNRLIQGGFRYQKLNLVSKGSLSLRKIGVHPTTDTRPIEQLPGAFNSSDEVLNRIWQHGARTIQLTEIPKDTVPHFYNVSPEGTIAESQAPQVYGSAAAAQLLEYNMVFEVKALVGGFGYSVLADTLNKGIYISCHVADRTISAYYGSTALDQLVASAKLPENLTLSPDVWSTVSTSISLSGISVTIGGTEVMSFSQALSFVGSFGIGASFGDRAIFRNLDVTTPTGQIVYTNNLTNPSYLTDFFSGTNPYDTSVDGSRRDRIAYAGDLDIAGGAALVSTHGLDFIIGSLNLLGSYQAIPGFFIPTAKIQQEPLATPLNVSITGLIGYSFNFLSAVASTYMHTGDPSFAKKWAPHVQAMLDWTDSQTLDNGLFNVSQVAFGGDWNYYDPPYSGVVTKFNALYAYALQECLQLLTDAGVNATLYQHRLQHLKIAIDGNLWNDTLGAYHLSNTVTGGFAQDANAIAILAGVNLHPNHSTDTILASLDTLMTPRGPQAFSSGVIADGFQPYISPYASSYHLRAALAAGNSDSTLQLLRNLWGPMADATNENYTGTFWETLDQYGHPAFGISTSLCHGWAAGPTAELSKHVLGATPVTPGWAKFKVAPQTLGLSFAAGRIPITQGTISVEWRFDDDLLSMLVQGPASLNGTVYLPQPLRTAANETVFIVNGAEQKAPFVFDNGNIFIQQKRY